jgi:vacuolar-type H+-ATPase subunit H
MNAMTKYERDDLHRLIRHREKVLKSAAKQRSAEVLADFENQMGQEYRFDDDRVWSEATKIADAAVAKAQEQIRARCREIGIPDRFAPSISLAWHHRGYGNSLKERREELRKMAQTAVEAQEQKAKTQIELSCLDAQTKLAVSGLTSEAALGFVEALPSVEELMPRLSFAEVAGESQPPVAARLLSSNALRQQRFRERRAAALQSVTEPLQVADVTGSNGGGSAP